MKKLLIIVGLFLSAFMASAVAPYYFGTFSGNNTGSTNTGTQAFGNSTLTGVYPTNYALVTSWGNDATAIINADNHPFHTFSNAVLAQTSIGITNPVVRTLAGDTILVDTTTDTVAISTSPASFTVIATGTTINVTNQSAAQDAGVLFSVGTTNSIWNFYGGNWRCLTASAIFLNIESQQFSNVINLNNFGTCVGNFDWIFKDGSATQPFFINIDGITFDSYDSDFMSFVLTANSQATNTIIKIKNATIRTQVQGWPTVKTPAALCHMYLQNCRIENYDTNFPTSLGMVDARTKGVMEIANCSYYNVPGASNAVCYTKGNGNIIIDTPFCPLAFPGVTNDTGGGVVTNLWKNF